MERQKHLIRFEHPNIITCSMCETHLALEQSIIWKTDPAIRPGRNVVITYMVNLDLADNECLEDHVRAPVSCKNCFRCIGHQLVDMHYLDIILVAGRFEIDTTMVHLRIGDKLLDAYTQDPIDGNGRLKIVHYRLNTNFYLCRMCKTHIALENAFINRFPHLPRFAIFETTVVNVHTGANFFQESHARAPVYCSVCYTKLGNTITAMGEPDAYLKEGRFMLNLKNMLFWGWDRLIDAFTQEPYDPQNA